LVVLCSIIDRKSNSIAEQLKDAEQTNEGLIECGIFSLKDWCGILNGGQLDN